MTRSSLPKELRLCINRLANEKAASGGEDLVEYRNTYLEEKLRLLEVVVEQLGAGVSVDGVMRNLGIVENRRRAALKKSLGEARKLIMEME